MATVRGALAIYDGVSGPIKKIHTAMNMLINTFENVQDLSSNAINTESLQYARQLVAESVAEWDRMADSVRGADEAQERFNNHIRDGTTAADGLGNKLKGILATVVSIAGVKSALNWGKENFELANIQRNAENQLKLVLANMGAQDVEIPVDTTANDAAASLSACKDAVNQLDGATAGIGVNMGLDTQNAESNYSAFVKGADGSTMENTLALDATGAAGVYEEWAGAADGNTLENALTLDTGGAAANYNNFVDGVSGNRITIGVQADTTQTVSAFDAITAKASEIQGRGIYGDEAMIAGAAELATYFDDANAIMSMMDTLSNYAMGMSGGGEVDSAAMVQYATNLGKVMTGTYTAMSQKGFQFTDAQKAIIEGTATEAQIVEALGAEYLDMSSDMQAAAAINSVISEAWDGLYDAMSNTPEGKILQFNHTLGDIKETLGNRLYPAALHFFDVFTSKFPQIESVLTWFTDGLSVLIQILTWIATLGLNVASVFTENWSWISPIIYGIAGVMMVYWAATKGVAIAQGIATAATTAYHAAVNFLSIGMGVLRGNTAAASAAVFTFNSALMASPITWVIIGIIALIAVIFAATAAINHFANKSYSATGFIAGLFATLGAHLINTFIVPAWNAFAMIANFIGNVFNDPVAAVKVLFYDMVLTVVGYIKNMAEAIETLINKIPGVTVDITSGLDSFYNGLEKAQQEVKDESGWVEYVQKMDFIDYRDAAKAGYQFGEGLEDTVSGMFKLPTLDEMGFDDFGNNLEGIYGNTGDTAANTAATADALEYTDEDLKYLRDIAEREAINRYTTAQITLEQHNENHIAKDTDLDGIMDAWAADFAERLDVSGEGV